MNSRSLIVTVIVCATALMIASLIANAGPLSPPAGPIAPTNKTLAEVEPRIAINATNTPGDADSLFRIAAPGSYYLTGNIAGVAARSGIEISSDGVTLDLMGFELLGVAGSLDGISVTFIGSVNIHIHNGSVRDWSGDGVDAGFAFNSSLRDLRAEGNAFSGLSIGEGGLVEACAARSNGGAGISAGAGSTVIGNTAQDNGSHGIIANIGSTISGNTAHSNTGDGISASSSSTVSGNTARTNGSSGISAGSGCTVSGNTVRVNTDDGIRISSDCLVLNNNCDSNGQGAGDGAGIYATSSDNRIDGNNVTDNVRGIDVDLSGNLIIRNSASGNAINYDIVANNKVGTIVSAPNSLAISGSTGGAGVGTTNPWANFSY